MVGMVRELHLETGGRRLPGTVGMPHSIVDLRFNKAESHIMDDEFTAEKQEATQSNNFNT